MEMQPYVTQVQGQLTAAAALGDESTRAIAEALSRAAEPAIRLALLDALSAAADEITAALLDANGPAAVSVRVSGDDLLVEARRLDDEPVAGTAAFGSDDTENAARISLRLPEALKIQIDAAARARAISVNTWLVRAATAALSGSPAPRPDAPGPDRAPRHRITGWINA